MKNYWFKPTTHIPKLEIKHTDWDSKTFSTVII